LAITECSSLIGKGTWGAVYLAIQLSVNRPVGLKVLNPNEAQDDHSRSRFLSDARAKAAVQHPFIVSVFEADERNGSCFTRMSFIDGATLEDMIVSGQKFDEKAALHVMKVAGEGLNYLWSHNLRAFSAGGGKHSNRSGWDSTPGKSGNEFGGPEREHPGGDSDVECACGAIGRAGGDVTWFAGVCSRG
jgi:hypothetical protein